jgi:hypothetical protein
MPLASDANSALDFAMRITKLTAAQLALNLESLGANCEPGFFQRKCGVEPLSLLRFSGVTLYSLVASIDDGFTGLGDRATIDPVPEETTLRDWIIYERRHLLRYHTWVRISDASRETMKSREAKRLPFLRAKLLEDLNDGLKTFVHVTSQPISDAEIWPLFLAIRRRGRGRLLVIGPSDYSHQAGMVEEIYSGLMRGYFDDFFHGQIGKISMPAWFAVCTGAWLLQHCRS